MKEIIFVSPIFVGLEHIPFEVSIIKLYLKMYPDSIFSFFGEKKHFEHIQGNLSANSIIRTKTINTNSRMFILLFTFTQCFFKKGSNIIYLGLNPFPLLLLLPFINIKVGFMHRYTMDSKNFITQVFAYLSLKYFLFFKKRVKIIVLGSWILKGIKLDRFLTRREKKNFFSFNHPYLLSYQRSKILGGKKINFGFIGRQLSAKHKKTKEEELNNVVNTIEQYGGKCLTTGERFISQKKYLGILSKCDFIIFLSDPNSYRYRCSGVLIEAIVNKKILICKSGDLTNFLFQKYGSLGHKCRNMDEIIKIIPKILNNDFNYKEVYQNLIIAKQDFCDLKNLMKHANVLSIDH